MLALVYIHSVQLRKLFHLKLSPITVQSNTGHLIPVLCRVHQGFQYSTKGWTATSQDTVYFYDKMFSYNCLGDTDRSNDQPTGPTKMLKQ